MINHICITETDESATSPSQLIKVVDVSECCVCELQRTRTPVTVWDTIHETYVVEYIRSFDGNLYSFDFDSPSYTERVPVCLITVSVLSSGPCTLLQELELGIGPYHVRLATRGRVVVNDIHSFFLIESSSIR